jgi:site-specific DNA-cytosine methylase
MNHYLEVMPSNLKRWFLMHCRLGVSAASTLCGGSVSYASACSGTDIAAICLEIFLNKTAEVLGLVVPLKHVYACEKHPLKQDFLKSQFTTSYIFGDVCDLGRQRSLDLLSMTEVLLPWSLVFTAGFSCKSRAQCSSRAAQNLNCLQRKDPEAETSVTYEGVKASLVRSRPLIFVLENVLALLEKASPEVASDAEFIIQDLQALGYYVKLFRVECENYGSRAVRARVYFIGWLVNRDCDLSTQPALLKKLDTETKIADSIWQCIVIRPLPHEMFLILEPADVLKAVDLTIDPASKSKHGKKDPQWEGEHCAAFRTQGIPWPPQFDSVAVLSDWANSGTYFSITGLNSERRSELLYFVHKTFPYIGSGVEYVDVNSSLGRAVGNDVTSPWRTTCPTMTGQSVMCVRYMLEQQLVVRPLCGIEVMQLAGWDRRYYKHPIIASEALLAEMAGNAFSGFAALPAFMVAFSVFGVIQTGFWPIVPVTKVSDVVDIYDGSDSDSTLPLS